MLLEVLREDTEERPLDAILDKRRGSIFAEALPLESSVSEYLGLMFNLVEKRLDLLLDKLCLLLGLLLTSPFQMRVIIGQVR